MRATTRACLLAVTLACMAPQALGQALGGSGFVQARPWLGVAIGAGDKGVLVNKVLTAPRPRTPGWSPATRSSPSMTSP